MKVCWSPFRPTVFVTVSNTGSVYVFDLIMSKQAPSYILEYKAPPSQLKLNSTSKAALSIGFNPVIRDHLAIGFHDGTVKIYQLNYSLSKAKPDELNILKSFMDDKES
jgi:WD40 repeat protein